MTTTKEPLVDDTLRLLLRLMPSIEAAASFQAPTSDFNESLPELRRVIAAWQALSGGEKGDSMGKDAPKGEPSPFQKFKTLAAGLMRVPKKEVDKLAAKEKRRKARRG